MALDGLELPRIQEPEPDDDEEEADEDGLASFTDIDINAPSLQPLPPPRAPEMQREDSRPVIVTSFLPQSRTPSPQSLYKDSVPRSPVAPLGRLGMNAFGSSRNSLNSSYNDASEDPGTMAADPTFASTSSLNLSRVASSEAEGSADMIVGNDAEGTFESVSLSSSARAAEKQPERPPSARSVSAPVVTINGVNGINGDNHDDDIVVEAEQPKRASTPPPQPTQSNHVSPTKRNHQGRTVLQKVLSKTRQRDLPPKEKQEDDRHLREYTAMMSQSRELEKKKREESLAKRKSREIEMLTQLPSWERDILPNWKVVLSDTTLRWLWWEGTMPARFRANLWSASIGNVLAIGKSSFARSSAKAQSLLSSGRVPREVIKHIEADMEETFPKLKLFQRERPMWDDLRNLLLAYSIFQRDRAYYPRGASWLAALLLISLPIADAFVCLANLVEKSFLKSFYAPKKDEIEAYYRIFGTLLADKMPPVYRNFVAVDIRPPLYLYPWLTTCFGRFLPIDCATRILDVFVLEGDSFLFRVALAFLEALEARLFNPDRDEVAAIFSASDKGTRAVVARTEGLGADDEVLFEDFFVACTGGEDRIFQLLRQMDWREATWLRLIERELPE